MKTAIALVLAAGLGFAGAASAQPSGGPDAKGNAPLKPAHTVNDGAAKPGANSFTQNQARQHILNSGYTSVSGLTKGDDGVWRGTAMKGGASMKVALDFKGNVSEEGMATPAPARHVRAQAPAPAMRTTTTTTTTDDAAMGAGTAAAGATAMAVTHHMHHHHHRHMYAYREGCPGSHMHHVSMDGQGAAVSGVDRNMNGVSDKEDRAMAH